MRAKHAHKRSARSEMSVGFFNIARLLVLIESAIWLMVSALFVLTLFTAAMYAGITGWCVMLVRWLLIERL